MKNSWFVPSRNPTLIFVAAGLFGCTAGVKVKTGTGGSSGAGAGTGSAGTTGSGGGSTGAAGGSTGNTTGGVDANVSADAACATSSAGAEPVPLDLYVLMDSSKSMLETTSAGVSKWSAVSSAMGMFFSDTGSAGLGVAIKYFPDEQAGAPATCTADTACGTFGPCDRRETCVGANGSATQVTPLCLSNTDCSGSTPTCALIKDCGGGNYCASAGTGTCPANCATFAGYCDNRDICDSTKYATPDVPIITLPDTTNALVPSLMNHTPDGYTPTGPALTGAISFAKQRLLSVPEHKIAVVLVTDGLPGGFIPGFPPAQCAPSDIAGVASIAMGGATASSPVLTFVIGVFNPGIEATTAKTNLDMLATAGGTGNAVVIDISQDVTTALHAALTQAQTKAIACSYQIPAATHGTADLGKVNVQFTSGTGAVTIIGHTTSKDACSKGGWYYDIDPSVGTPTKIIACDSTCADFQADNSSGHVDIVLGCATIVIDTGI